MQNYIFRKYQCPHCNYQLVNHHLGKVEESLLLFCRKFFYRRSMGRLRIGTLSLEELIFFYLNKILQTFNLIRIVDNYDRTQIFNRSLVLLDEAKKRNIRISPLTNYKNQYLNYFYLQLGNKDYYFEGLPVNLFAKDIDVDLIDDKYRLKKFLLQQKMPVVEGAAFITCKAGYKYGQQLGFPLVVKPRDGSLSNHVTIKIDNLADLRQAIEIVKQYTNFYIVEKFIPGDVHRITIIGDKVFAAKRLAACVVGNGQASIEQLIELKNQHPYRGETLQKDTTLHKISIDQITIDLLSQQGYTLETILASGLVVYLKNKVNLTAGCDIMEVSEQIYPANRDLFLQLAQLLNTDILGIDFICTNISQPYFEQPSAIIECNSLPYIDMHHFPSQGEAQNVAGAIVELIIDRI
ncbi:MAG: hypothetical protein NT116_05180 [Candidatus Parcubacteria bacterium]|nr:hypothetical protein [Candidatus Parcubacteria bacterium]